MTPRLPPAKRSSGGSGRRVSLKIVTGKNGPQAAAGVGAWSHTPSATATLHAALALMAVSSSRSPPPPRPPATTAAGGTHRRGAPAAGAAAPRPSTPPHSDGRRARGNLLRSRDSDAPADRRLPCETASGPPRRRAIPRASRRGGTTQRAP